MPRERLQKVLAQAGIGSRRQCEELIQKGRVEVNGITAKIGEKADPMLDRIILDGKLIELKQQYIYIALYKPRGYLSTINKDDNRPSIFDLVDIKERVYPVGRLDFYSEGLILLTNDGEMTNRLTHPKYQHEKEYRVKVVKRPDMEQLEKWRRGVVLEDGYRTQRAKVEISSSVKNGAWLKIILREGKKRQIRLTGKIIGLPVERIIRIRIANLELGNLKPKKWRYLNSKEIHNLKKF